MSFKRDGNDSCLLNNLKKRRVGDLLVGHIPEDEALLLKNGRYSCTVCFHRPIFDTLEMLAIHRKGKKHLHYLTRRLQQQQELKDLKIRRIQEDSIRKGQCVQNGDSRLPKTCNPQLTKRHGLLKAKPYNSCNKKRSKGKSNKFSRKESLVLNDVQADLSTTDRDTQSDQLKPPPETNPSAIIKSYLKTIRKKKNFCDVVEKQRRQYTSLPPSTEAIANPVPTPPTTSKEEQKYTSELTPVQAIILQEKKKRTEFFVNLRQQGWKKDLSGNWVKDEDAEFDSDEEIPPEYPG